MATGTPQIIEAAQAGFALQSAELAAARARQLLVVVTQGRAGSSDIDESFSLDRRYRLVFVRCHFVGGSGASALSLYVDSAVGAAHDARLFTMTQAGTGQDVNFRINADELAEPSPWTFQPGDAVRVEWANPDSGHMSWGIEVGFALAS
jgi:hypothetical protein